MWDCILLDLASQEIVDVENKEVPSFLIVEVVLGCLEQIAEDLDHNFMGGGLDGAFEIEVVDYFCFGVYEIQEGSGMV